jgi:hypothetical protein
MRSAVAKAGVLEAVAYAVLKKARPVEISHGAVIGLVGFARVG